MPTRFVTSFTNQIAIGEDGWGMIAPYGDFEGVAFTVDANGRPRREIAVQRVTKENVTQMVNAYNAARRGVTKFLTAAPIFRGHPDAMDPVEAQRNPDRAPKGVFAQVRAGEKAFEGEPLLLPEGAQLVASRQAPYFSVNWMTEPTGETVERGGQKLKVYEPKEFISAALCKNPRLPVQMLNENDPFTPAPDGQNTNTMKKLSTKIAAVLTKHGIQFTNEMSDEQIDAAIEQLGAKVDSTTANFTNEKTGLETQLQAEKEKAKTANESLTTARTQFTNERAAHTKTVLGHAVETGRITEAERADWERRLGVEAQFTNELAALGALKPKVKTEAAATRGDVQLDFSTPQKRAQFLNESVETLAKERNVNAKVPTIRRSLEEEVYKAHPDLKKNVKRSAFNAKA